MQISVTGLAARASAKDRASLAPKAIKASAFPGDRFHTVIGCPAASIARASADPINPNPIQEIRLIAVLPLRSANDDAR